jgi:hypothetical protein
MMKIPQHDTEYANQAMNMYMHSITIQWVWCDAYDIEWKCDQNTSNYDDCHRQTTTNGVVIL